MLVLSRKKNESIDVDTSDGPVTITVIEIRGDKVRIGIEADRNISVHRHEVTLAIAEQEAEAAVA